MARKRNTARRLRLAAGAGALTLTSLAAVPVLLAGTAVASSSYGPHAATLTESTAVVSPGGTDTLQFEGAVPGELFHIYINGLLIGTGTANSSGRLIVRVVIPASLAAGHYTITAVGNEGDVLSVPIEIVAGSPAPAGVTPPSGTPTVVTGSTPLAFTGTDEVATAGAGAAAVAVGGLIVLGARRRRRPAWRG